jgi:hypothetical protein
VDDVFDKAKYLGLKKKANPNNYRERERERERDEFNKDEQRKQIN